MPQWPEALLDLVCGLSLPIRERWPIMALQAYVDDSQTTGKVLVMAGYISTAKKWAEFTLEWDEILAMRPGDAKFHANQLDWKNEQHREWAQHLYRVVERHVIAGVVVAVDLEAVRILPDDPYIPKGAQKPYMLAYKACIDMVIQQHASLGIVDPVDFIFDKRSEERIVREAYNYYEDSLPPEYAGLAGRPPRFENDDYFKPLQAADMLAWFARLHWLKYGSICGSYVEFPWDVTQSIPIAVLDLTGADLVQQYLTMKNIYRQRHSVTTLDVSVTFSCDLSMPDDHGEGS
jgi:hypothetical protein